MKKYILQLLQNNDNYGMFWIYYKTTWNAKMTKNHIAVSQEASSKNKG